MKILTIGRKGTDIVLEDAEKQISRLHAELTVTDGGRYYLVDCGSSNGTSVKHQGTWKPIKQEYVNADDEVRFSLIAAIKGRVDLRARFDQEQMAENMSAASRTVVCLTGAEVVELTGGNGEIGVRTAPAF